jgi:uncharacterized protein
MATLLIWLIRAYQAGVSPRLGAMCRYSPSCSQYTIDAIEMFGAIRGSWMGLKRILRCHPWSAGGHDPVLPHSDG